MTDSGVQFITVHTLDGQSNSIEVPSDATAGSACETLARQHGVTNDVEARCFGLFVFAGSAAGKSSHNHFSSAFMND